MTRFTAANDKSGHAHSYAMAVINFRDSPSLVKIGSPGNASTGELHGANNLLLECFRVFGFTKPFVIALRVVFTF
jgi:hypothetical protein